MADNFLIKQNYNCDDLLLIMAKLRSENGCPWDKEQTHKSIRNNMIEEAYEVVEAIDFSNKDMLCEELGDVLLQVVFHSKMAQEKNEFDFDDVSDGICKKLIERHPHIFGNVKADTSEQVLKNWDAIKQKQKNQTSYTETVKSVPQVLPSLMRSQKVQKRAAKSGFDYPDLSCAMNALISEISELKQAIENDDKENIIEELGDIIFSAVNISRFLNVDAEEATGKSCDKFIDRFSAMESLAQSKGVDMKDMDIFSLDNLWEEVKLNNKNLEEK